MALIHRLALIVAVLGAALVAPASALAEVHVLAGERLGHLTVIADNVRVDGTVTGSVIVVDGSVTVGPDGHLADGATILGGHLVQEAGARVRGNVIQLGQSWPLPEGPAAVAVVAGLIALRILLALFVVRVAGVLADRRAAAPLRRELAAFPIRTLALGTVAGFGLGAISLLFAITILGLVAAAALWGLLLAAGIAAIAALFEAFEGRETRRLTTFALIVPVLGEIAGALAVIVGVGSCLRAATAGSRSIALGPRSAADPG